MNRLEPILEEKRLAVARRLGAQRVAAAPSRPDRCRSLRAAIGRPGGPHLIAEVKRRTPTIPQLREPFDPVALARTYAGAGAAAISIVVDEPFFGGSLAWVTQVRQAVPLPVLAKDFLLDSCQVDDVAAAGADALLVIADIVPETLLVALLERCRQAQVEALVEVHTDTSLQRALRAGAPLIGINNRDLRSFEIDPTTAFRLAPRVPFGTPVVAESGISRREEIVALRAVGVWAVLVGEAILTSSDVAAKIRELLGRPSLP